MIPSGPKDCLTSLALVLIYGSIGYGHGSVCLQQKKKKGRRRSIFNGLDSKDGPLDGKKKPARMNP